MDKVRTLTRRGETPNTRRPVAPVNPVLRGWCNYFRHGVSKRTFSYLDHYAFWRIFGWLRKRHPRLNRRTLVRRHLPGLGDQRRRGIEMFRPRAVTVDRYRYRGTKIPTPWASEPTDHPHQRPEHVESRMR